MAAAAKRNPELKGFERPTNEQLDEVFGEYLDARDARDAAKMAFETAKEAATEAMREVADQLEKDERGRPTYRYRDGERHVQIALTTSTELTVKKLKPDDDEADIEDADIG